MKVILSTLVLVGAALISFAQVSWQSVGVNIAPVTGGGTYAVTNYYVAPGSNITVATNVTGTNVTWTITGSAGGAVGTVINTTAGTAGAPLVLSDATGTNAVPSYGGEPFQTVSTNYTITYLDNNKLLLWNSATNCTVFFGDGATNGFNVTLKTIGAGLVTITNAAGKTFDGQTSIQLPTDTISHWVADGTNYRGGRNGPRNLVGGNKVFASPADGSTNLMAPRALVAGDVTPALNGATLSGPLLSASTIQGVYQPYDLSKTFVVALGDSITADNLSPSDTNIGAWYAYPYIATHGMPQWSGLHFYTNLAVGGENLTQQTNRFWTNAFPLLPTSCTGGTNVIVSIWSIGNDLIAWANSDVNKMITNYVPFLTSLKSMGYTIVMPTPTPRPTFNYQYLGAIFQWNEWLRQSTGLVDVVPDFYRHFPDCMNTNVFFDTVHFNEQTHTNAAIVWDNSIRFKTRNMPTYLVRGTNASAGSWGSWLLNTNGTWTLFMGDNGVFWPFQGMYMSGSGAGNDMVKLINTAANGRDYWVGSRNLGMFNIRNDSGAMDCFVLQNRGITITNNGPNNIVAIYPPNARGGCAGSIRYTLLANDGSNSQVGGGRLEYRITIKGSGTPYFNVTDNDILTSCSTGTLTWGWTNILDGNVTYIAVTPVSSLIPTGMTARWTLMQNGSAGNVTSF